MMTKCVVCESKIYMATTHMTMCLSKNNFILAVLDALSESVDSLK